MKVERSVVRVAVLCCDAINAALSAQAGDSCFYQLLLQYHPPSPESIFMCKVQIPLFKKELSFKLFLKYEFVKTIQL